MVCRHFPYIALFWWVDTESLRIIHSYTPRVNPVKETMNLESLKWTKNVRPADGWAYCEFESSKLFKLAWRKDEANADKPERNDLILLRQHGYVTHLVKVLNHKSEREDWLGDYNLYRIVEVLWTINCSNPPDAAKADVIFDFPEVLDFMGGNAMKLEELPTFSKAWQSRGGLSAFQDHVKSRLLSAS